MLKTIAYSEKKTVKPVWILAHWRSGSNYLAGLLNSTKLFDPPIDEWLRDGKWTLKNLPPYANIDGIRSDLSLITILTANQREHEQGVKILIQAQGEIGK